MADDQKSGVDKLKSRLYSRKENLQTEDIRTPLEAHTNDVPVGWEPTPVTDPVVDPVAAHSSPVAPAASPTRSSMSLSMKFLLGSIGFFIVAAAVSALVFFNGGNVISPQNIDLQIVAPSLIDGGKEATFQVLATNRNQSDLILVDMIIDYPDGTRNAADPTKALTHDRQSLGTIKAGQQVKKTITGIFYGQEGSTQKLKVTLEYNVVGSNAVFQKQAEADFTVGSSPVSLSVTSPQETTAGNEFTMTVAVRSNATTPINNIVVQGQYPFGFSVTAATPQANAGGTLWRLGTINPGATKTITLKGKLDGQDGDERIFRFQVGSNQDQTDTKIKVPYLTMPQTITVHRPFVSSSISVEGQSGSSVSVAAGKKLQGRVHWQNNLSESVSDAEVVLTLSGPALDKNSVDSVEGFYQSSDTSIIWSKDKVPGLASVAPGASGDFQFSFSTLPPAAGNVLITNPTIKLNVEIRGTRQSGNTTESIGSAAALTVQLASAATISAQASHFSGPFINIGPMPPKAETGTTYSIVLTVKNSSNELANASVSTVLPPFVQFVSAIQGEGVTYDAPSRTVRWPVGTLKAGVGYTLPTRQAAFQVTLVPSSSQVGQIPPLTGPISFTAQDRFAQVNVSAQADAPTTKLTGESGFTSGMEIVAPK
jgi:hypothetical protein